MKQAALKYFTAMDLPLTALVLFFLAFAFLIYRVYFYESQEHIEQLARIPLGEEDSKDVK